MHNSKLLREVFNEKYEKNLLKEKKFDPYLDIKLDRIPVVEENDDDNYNINSLYLTHKKFASQGKDNEKFFANKSNLIDKAKQYIIKKKLNKRKAKEIAKSTLNEKTTSTLYNGNSTRNNNFINFTITKPIILDHLDQRRILSSKSNSNNTKPISHRLTPFQKKEEECNQLIQEKIKQIHKPFDINLCLSSRSLDASNNSYTIQSKRVTSFIAIKNKRRNLSTSHSLKNLFSKSKKIPKSLLNSKILSKKVSSKINQPQLSLKYFNIHNNIDVNDKNHSILKSTTVSPWSNTKKQSINGIKLYNFNDITKNSFSNLKEYTNRLPNTKKIKMAIFKMDKTKYGNNLVLVKRI